jgi:hypothetical protein
LNIRSGFPALLMVAAGCILIGVGACSDNEEEEIKGFNQIRVLVLDEADEQPVSGIKVMLMAPERNCPIAGPLVSNMAGECDFGVQERWPLRLVVFGGLDYVVHALPDFDSEQVWAQSGSGTGSDSPVAPHAKTSPPPIIGLRVLVKKVIPDSLPRIAGQVVDAESGVPLGGAFISMSPDLTGYQGATSSSDDVTNATGGFSVSPIPMALDPETENLIQINPLRVTRNGYRPAIWKYESPNGSQEVDISGITIALDRVRATDTASLSGLILRDGLPARDVMVGLGVLRGAAADKAAVGMTGYGTITGQDGRFTISGLPDGTYILQPGYALADGVFFPTQAAPNVFWKVEVGASVDVGSLVVWHEIEPVSPPHGASLTSQPGLFQWTEVPGAAAYQPYLDRAILPIAKSNMMTLPEDMILLEGVHYWSIQAMDKDMLPIGTTQIQATFRILPSEG